MSLLILVCNAKFLEYLPAKVTFKIAKIYLGVCIIGVASDLQKRAHIDQQTARVARCPPRKHYTLGGPTRAPPVRPGLYIKMTTEIPYCLHRGRKHDFIS